MVASGTLLFVLRFLCGSFFDTFVQRRLAYPNMQFFAALIASVMYQTNLLHEVSALRGLVQSPRRLSTEGGVVAAMKTTRLASGIAMQSIFAPTSTELLPQFLLKLRHLQTCNQRALLLRTLLPMRQHKTTTRTILSQGLQRGSQQFELNTILNSHLPFSSVELLQFVRGRDHGRSLLTRQRLP
jgi:hypothetical protein